MKFLHRRRQTHQQIDLNVIPLIDGRELMLFHAWPKRQSFQIPVCGFFRSKNRPAAIAKATAAFSKKPCAKNSLVALT